MPILLKRAGFDVKKVKVLPQNNFEVGPQLIDYFIESVNLMHFTNKEIVSSEKVASIKQEFDRYLEKHEDHWFATYPEVITMGEKI